MSVRKGRRLVAIAVAAVLIVGGLIVAAVGTGSGGHPSAAVQIEVTSSQGIQRVSPLVFGLNTRYGYNAFGSFDPGSRTVSEKLAGEVRQAGISVLRYPGGTQANTFQWQQAIGPAPQRGCQAYGGPAEPPATNGGQPLNSDYGPDEGAQFAAGAGATEDIVVNFATGTPEQAASWVAYMNATTGPEASLRAQNGHPAPYGVKTWEVGNEMEDPAQHYWMGTGSAGDAAKKYVFGGSTTFAKQPLGRGCDHQPTSGQSTGAANQTLSIYYPPVIPTRTKVMVSGTVWKEVRDLQAVGRNSESYQLDASTGQVTFGDGVHGAIPPAGAPLTASYTSGPHRGFVDFYRAMKQADPSINVCSGFTSSSFLKLMSSNLPYDCLQVHPYGGGSLNTLLPGPLHDAAMATADNRGSLVQGWLDQIRNYSGVARGVDLSEYGLGFPSTASGPTPDYLSSLDQGLYTASELVHWISLGVPVAEKHSLVDFAPGVGPTPGVADSRPDQAAFGYSPSFVPSATALVFDLFTHMTGDEEVRSAVQAGPVTSSSKGPYPDLLTLATKSPDGHLYLVVINRSANHPVRATVKTDDPRARQRATLWAVSGPSTVASNTPASPTSVGLAKTDITVSPGAFTRTFPARSVSAIAFTPR